MWVEGVRGPSTSQRDVDLIVSLLRAQPLTRKQLLEAWKEERDSGDSAMRCAVEAARADGWPLIWKDKRYRLAGSWEELSEWVEREATPRAHRILSQVAAMRRRAIEFFPPEQTRLLEVA